MKIALAQVCPIGGNVITNIATHLAAAEAAAVAGADLVLFPELSLTGYEPGLAATLATQIDHGRWASLQNAADARGIVLGVGLPTREPGGGIAITQAFFRPHQLPVCYSKQYLHADEEPYFVPGTGTPYLEIAGGVIAVAICYEISVPKHTAAALATGASLFLASVSKSTAGMEKSATTLAALALDHGLTTAIVNGIGPADNFVAAGGSAAWNPRGECIARLSTDEPGLLIFDVPS